MLECVCNGFSDALPVDWQTMSTQASSVFKQPTRTAQIAPLLRAAIALLLLPWAAMACSEDANAGEDANASVDAGAVFDAAVAPIDAMLSGCTPFSNTPESPLEFEDVFTETSELWRRPADPDDNCPAVVLLPDQQASPLVVHTFCNSDSVSHRYNIEMFSVEGPNGEQPLQDPFLVIYDGEEIPDDPQACRGINNTGPTVDDNSAQLLDVEVSAGASLTIVATSFAFVPKLNAGIGGFRLVITNTD